LAADSVGPIDLEGGPGFLVTLRCDPDVDPIGENPECNGFGRDRRHLLTRELVLGLQQEVADMLELGSINYRHEHEQKKQS
jgi:hypothetical protein